MALISSINMVINPDITVKQCLMVIVLSLLVLKFGYDIERIFAPDDWSESVLSSQRVWLSVLMFFAASIGIFVFSMSEYMLILLGVGCFIVPMDDKRLPTRQEWSKIIKIALSFAIMAAIIIFLFQFIEIFPA